MARTKYIIRERKFIGYNDTAPPEQLGSGVLALLKNGFCVGGEIIKRTGYSAIGNDLGSVACQGIKGVSFSNGTKIVIGIFNGLVYKWTGTGNWTALTGSYTLAESGLIDIVVANDSVYFFDGTNTVPKYNGSTMSTVGSIPVGKYAKWLNNQLHVAGILNDINALKSSVAGDPETFTSGISSDLDISANDGDEIAGLNFLGSSLLVAKKSRIFAVSGLGTSALTVDDVSQVLYGLGTTSHFGMVNVGNSVLYPVFLGNKVAIRRITKNQYGNIVDGGVISDEIETTLSGVNKSALNVVTGFYDGKYAWMAFPNGSSTYNNLVLTLDIDTLDRKNKGWAQHTGINASCFTNLDLSTTPKVYFGEGSADSKAYVFDTSTSDNGTAISFEARSRRYGGEDSEIRKKWYWLWLWAKEQTSDYDVTVDFSQDGFSWSNLGTIGMMGSGGALDTMVLDTSRLGSTDVRGERTTFPKVNSHYLQLKIYDSSALSSITIRNWEVVSLKRRPIDE